MFQRELDLPTSPNFIKKGLKFLNFCKLGMSYETTGSDQIGNYGYLDSYFSTYSYQGSSLIPTRIANPDYAWEVNKKENISVTF